MHYFTFAITRLRDDECGTITIDWVVLTTGIIGVVIAILAAVPSPASEIGRADSMPALSVSTSHTQDIMR